VLCGYFCFWRFYGYFPLLISFFGWVLLIQLESPNIGDLGFVALDNYCNRQRGKTSRYVLLQRRYKLELSVCLYDKYLMRYEFLKNFEGFLSRPRHGRLRRTDEIFSPPTLSMYCAEVGTRRSGGEDQTVVRATAAVLNCRKEKLQGMGQGCSEEPAVGRDQKGTLVSWKDSPIKPVSDHLFGERA